MKTAEHEMILPYAKLFNEKMREQLVKYEKKKKHVSDFSKLWVDDMKKKRKNINLFCSYKSTEHYPNTTIFTQQA